MFLSNSWYLSVKKYFSRYYKAAVNTKFPSGKEFLKDWIIKQKFLSDKARILSVWPYLSYVNHGSRRVGRRLENIRRQH